VIDAVPVGVAVLEAVSDAVDEMEAVPVRVAVSLRV